VEKYRRAGAGHRRQYGACALHTGYLKLQTHTQVNTHCFSTATMVARKRLNVTLYVQWQSFFYLLCESIVDASSELIKRRRPVQVHTLLRNEYRKENDGLKSLRKKKADSVRMT